MDKRDLFFIEDLGPLYADVQRSGLLEDSKTFPDSLPLHPVSVITAAYAVAKHLPGFDLLAFVKKHFKLPDQQEPDYDSAQKPIRNHLEELWAVLTRTPDQAGGTLIPLPHPYIVPGGRFREIYYWDSYFTMLGLQATGRIDIMRNMVDNFAWLIDNFGFIPNGNRTYYLGRSQPPYFALMVGLLADVAGKQFLLQYRTQMKREYEFWMDGAENLSEETPSNRRVVRLSDGSVLNRYWDDNPSPRPEAFMEDEDVAQNAGGDPLCIFRHIRAAAESGWDFSSRWQRDPRDMGTIETTDLIPVDLNCLLYQVELILAETAAVCGDDSEIDLYQQRAAARKEAVQRFCWDPTYGFYYDFNFTKGVNTGRITLAAAATLFFGLATAEQANSIKDWLASQFLRAGGMTTTIIRTGQQWDGPNGWAPLQWLAYKGLLRYGFNELAERARISWVGLNERTYEQTGKMMEKYNVMDQDVLAGGGEYPNQDGFGWTNGVYLAMIQENQG